MTLKKAKISSTYSSTSVVEPTRAQLKQKQLNFFFRSAKILPQTESAKELNGEEKLQRSLVNQEVIDLCQDSSSEIEDTEMAGLTQFKEQVPKTVRTKNQKKRKKPNHSSKKSNPLDIVKSRNVEIIPSKVSFNKKLNTVVKESKPNNKIPQKKSSGIFESEKNECPSYKVVEGTTFAVDAFNYGILKNVTTYFLTHFHTDHYVGLTKKFSMPIFASEITTNLIRGFISVKKKLLNILFLNTTVEVEGVYVTAIDANHCPGAIMLLFQLPCGKRILHTGDFRWSLNMELNPYLNQEHIELIYLDTTHISDKHIISSQAECISKAIHWVREFKERNKSKKILFVVCTDVIGKENFWLSIAKAFDLKVWSDGKRKKALSIIGNEEIMKRLVSNANEADLHVVSHVEAGFRNLDEYFHKFSDSYDMVLSIKPKGSDSVDPEFVGPVNSVSVRYSEHSTHKELRRFLWFLMPKRVISTVPSGKNIFRCPKIPVSWHSKELYVPYKKQTSILNYVSVKKT